MTKVVLVDRGQGDVVVVQQAPRPVVRVSAPPQGRVTALSRAGPKGDPGPPGSDADATAAIAAHIHHPTPHPAYDDTRSLVLIYENGLI